MRLKVRRITFWLLVRVLNYQIIGLKLSPSHFGCRFNKKKDPPDDVSSGFIMVVMMMMMVVGWGINNT